MFFAADDGHELFCYFYALKERGKIFIPLQLKTKINWIFKENFKFNIFREG